MDNNTPASSSVNSFNTLYLPKTILSASNTGITTTTASALRIEGAPTAGTNETITNSYALNVAYGGSYFSTLYFQGTSSIITTTTTLTPASSPGNRGIIPLNPSSSFIVITLPSISTTQTVINYYFVNISASNTAIIQTANSSDIFSSNDTNIILSTQYDRVKLSSYYTGGTTNVWLIGV